MTTLNSHPIELLDLPRRASRALGRWLVEPAASLSTVEAQRQARLLAWLLIILTPFTLVGALAPLMFRSANPLRDPFSTLMGGVALALLGAYALSRTRLYWFGAVLTIALLSAFPFGVIILRAEYSSSQVFGAFIWLLLPILLSNMLLSMRGTIFLIAADLLGVLLLPVFLPQVTFLASAAPLGFIATLSALIVVAGRHRDLLERDRQAELSQAAHELSLNRVQLEARAGDRTRDLALAAEVGQSLAQVRDLETLLAQAVEMIRARFDLYHTQVYLLEASGRTLALRAGTGEVGTELLRRTHRLPVGPGSTNGLAAAEKRAVIVADTTTSGAFWPNPLLPATRSEMAVPLLLGDRVVGVLDLQSSQPGALAEESLAVFKALAGQLAIAIENAALFAEAEQVRGAVEAQARRLARAGWENFLDATARSEHIGYAFSQATLTPLTEPAPALMAAAEPGALTVPISITGEPIGALKLVGNPDQRWGAEETELVATVARQVAQRVESLRLLADAQRYQAEAEEAARSLTRDGWAGYLERATAGQGYLYDLNQVLPLPAVDPAAQTFEPTLTMPLAVRGETVGELAIADVANLSDESAELVSAVAEKLSAHIENLRLFEQTQAALVQTEDHARRLARLNELSGEISLADTTAGIMQAVTAKAREIVHADRTSIILLTATGDYFQTISLSGEANPASAETLYPLAGTTAEIAVKQRRVVVITDPDLNRLPEMRRFTEQGLRSFMNVPLISGGSVIGALNVASRQPDAYTSRDENALSQIASLLAAALDNRRLLEQTERRAAQLEEATRFLDSVIENLPVMLFVKDAEELRFVRWNKAGEELVGFSRDDLLGKNDYDFFPKEEADFFTAKDREVLAGGQLLDIGEEPIQTAHRGARLLHTRKIPILGPDRRPKYLLGLSEDITERKRAEAEILRHNEELAALNRVVSVVTSSFNQRVILHAIAREVVHIFGAQKSGIALLDAGRQNLVVVADHSNSPDEPSAVGLVIALENNPSSVQVIETKRGLVVPQAQTNPLTASAHAILRARNTHCLMIVPLLARGEVIGTIGVDATDPNRVFSPEEVALAETIAGQIASAIENSRLFEETQRRALELETVAQVSTAASTILQAEELLQTVVDLTKTRFGLYHVHIYLLDDATQTLVLSAGAGEVGRQMVAEGRRIPLGWEQSLVARAARARQGVVVNDVRESPDFLSHPLLPNTRSELAVPMIVGDKVLGVFDVQADSVNRFTEEDVRIQTTLAEQVAVALQNANLYAEQAATVARLRELDHLKSAFLANMSHELRTPLNSILGFTEVLLEELDGPLTSQMENDLKIVYKNGQHLLNLISDVLDMAKIEAGKMALNPERFDLTEVLEEVLGLTHPMARAKSLELRLETGAPIADLQLEADRMRMRQVMINLVNNAIKFTEAGHVTVRAEQAKGAIRVSVEDTGLGIPPHQLESIFQEFTQVDTSTTRKAGGTGLGLPISRHLVEMHGGRLWAESAGIPGQGATFFAELPVESAYQRAREE